MRLTQRGGNQQDHSLILTPRRKIILKLVWWNCFGYFANRNSTYFPTSVSAEKRVSHHCNRCNDFPIFSIIFWKVVADRQKHILLCLTPSLQPPLQSLTCTSQFFPTSVSAENRLSSSSPRNNFSIFPIIFWKVVPDWQNHALCCSTTLLYSFTPTPSWSLSLLFGFLWWIYPDDREI